MAGRRISGGHDAVGDADPPGRPGGQHRHPPAEAGLPGHLGQVVGAGLEHRHPPGQELIAGEVAVVIGVGGRRGDVLGVDQVDHVAQCGDRLRVVEGEPVAVAEHPAGRADVVQGDALQVVGGVVAPLAHPERIEPGGIAAPPGGVEGQPCQQRAQRVVGRVGIPAGLTQCRRLHPGVGEQVGVVEQRDPGVGELRHPPQPAAPGELRDHRRLPVGRRRDRHQPVVVGVLGEVGVVHPEDVVGAAAGHIGAQRVEVARIGHQGGAHLDLGVATVELIEGLAVGPGHLLVPQPDRHHCRPRGFVGASHQLDHADQDQGDGDERGRDHRREAGPRHHLNPVT